MAALEPPLAVPNSSLSSRHVSALASPAHDARVGWGGAARASILWREPVRTITLQNVRHPNDGPSAVARVRCPKHNIPSTFPGHHSFGSRAAVEEVCSLEGCGDT